MSIHWPWIFLGGLFFVLIIVGLALCRPKKTAQFVPLARTFRLLDLPGYQRIRKISLIKNIATIICVGILIIGSFFLAARPFHTVDISTLNPKLTRNEIMICNEAPLESRASAAVYQYFSRLAYNPNNLLGVSTTTVRVIPITNQNWYVAKKLSDYSQVYGKIQKLGPNGKIEDASDDVLLLKAEYDKGVNYNNYTPNFIDNLAMCIFGFPQLAYEKTKVNRSVLYCGTNILPTTHASIYTYDKITDLARKYEIKLNILDGCTTGPSNQSAALGNLARSTGGIYETVSAFNPAVTTTVTNGQIDNALDSAYINMLKPLDPKKYPKQHITTPIVEDNSNPFIYIMVLLALCSSIFLMWVRR